MEGEDCFGWGDYTGSRAGSTKKAIFHPMQQVEVEEVCGDEIRIARVRRNEGSAG